MNEELNKDQENELPKDQEKEPEEKEQEEFVDEIPEKHYEILYILQANYTAEEVKPINVKIKKLIEEQGGRITKEDFLGKLKFAYPIKSQSHGYYQVLEFDLPKQNLHNLNNSLKLTNEILRFIIVKQKVKTEKEIKAEKDLQAKLAKRKEVAIDKMKEEKKEAKEKPKKEEKREKVSLEDLDKKLDEILGGDEML